MRWKGLPIYEHLPAPDPKELPVYHLMRFEWGQRDEQAGERGIPEERVSGLGAGAGGFGGHGPMGGDHGLAARGPGRGGVTMDRKEADWRILFFALAGVLIIRLLALGADPAVHAARLNQTIPTITPSGQPTTPPTLPPTEPPPGSTSTPVQTPTFTPTPVEPTLSTTQTATPTPGTVTGTTTPLSTETPGLTPNALTGTPTPTPATVETGPTTETGATSEPTPSPGSTSAPLPTTIAPAWTTTPAPSSSTTICNLSCLWLVLGLVLVVVGIVMLIRGRSK